MIEAHDLLSINEAYERNSRPFILKCFYCHQYSNIKPPIVICRYKYDQTKLSGICTNCGATKTGFLPRYILNKIPEITAAPTDLYRLSIDNVITPDGRFIPIFPIVDKYINVY